MEPRGGFGLNTTMEYDFLIRPDELVLCYRSPAAPRRLAYDRAGLDPAQWRQRAVEQLRNLLGVEPPEPCPVTRLREAVHQGVQITALVLRVDDAPCVPGILAWLDRADIAGLNAPRRLALHYGELDVPGPDNGSAAYNNTVDPAFEQLKRIYTAAGAPEAVTMHITEGLGHEIDNNLLLHFLTEDHTRQ
jgi:hypothetical protein